MPSGWTAPSILFPPPPMQLWHRTVTTVEFMHHERCISPFNNSQQNTEEDIWIQTSMLWLFVCSYLTTRRGDAGCVASLENTLSGHLPDGPLFNTRANTTLTSQQNIIRRSHQEERRRRSKTFLQHNISSTQHVQHAHNLRCVRQDQASTNQKSLLAKVWH